MFLSGDNADAKSAVRTMFEDAGFFVIDLVGYGKVGKCISSALRSPAKT